MTAAVTRDLTIVYGSTTIGGTTDYLIEGPFRLELDARKGVLECQVVLSKDTEADFLTAEATLYTAFRTDRQRLQITLGAATRHDFNPSTNSGFDHVPTIEKVKNEEATGQSARYQISIIWVMPGTLVNTDGHTEATIELTKTPAKLKQLRIAGTYTAITGFTAYANYVDKIDALVSTWTTIFTGTYNRVTEVATPNDTNKLCQFEVLYKEVLADEGVGVLDLAWVIDQQLAITRADVEPGDSLPGVRRPQELMVAYDAAIDRTVTTDLSGRWTSTILPHLLDQVRTTAGAGAIAAVEISPVFNWSENRLSATLRCLAYVGRVVEVEIEVEDVIDLGKVDVPVWDGQAFSRDVYDGPHNHTRTVTTLRTLVGGASSDVGGDGGLGLGLGGGVVGDLFGGQGLFSLPGSGSTKGHIPSSDHNVEGNFIERVQSRRRKVLHVGASVARVKLVVEYDQRVFTRAERPR